MSLWNPLVHFLRGALELAKVTITLLTSCILYYYFHKCNIDEHNPQSLPTSQESSIAFLVMHKLSFDPICLARGESWNMLNIPSLNFLEYKILDSFYIMIFALFIHMNNFLGITNLFKPTLSYLILPISFL